MTDNLEEANMEYMIVYPLSENYKETTNNIQRIMEKFKKFFETSKFPIRKHQLDYIFNSYINTYKYICLSSSMLRLEYYTDMPEYAGYDNYIIRNEDDNNVSIGEL